MDQELKDWYRELDSPLPRKPPARRPKVAVRGVRRSPGAAAVRTNPAVNDAPPLDRESLEEVRAMLKAGAQPGTNGGGDIYRQLGREGLEEKLEEVEDAFARPRAALKRLRVRRGSHMARPLPKKFKFEGMDLAAIPIDPDDDQFEEGRDALGWIVNTAKFAFGYPAGDESGFAHHADFTGEFVYSLPKPPAGQPARVAVLSDFGTGLYHSRYIAKHVASRSPQALFHLGDVYYAGRADEFARRFKMPLGPLMSRNPIYTLMGNHEMYSKAVPFFDYVKERRRMAPAVQRQEGSYFCVRSPGFNLVGIDCAYFGHGRYLRDDLRDWLKKRLEEGRNAGSINVLMCSDHPYAHGVAATTELMGDLGPYLGMIDFWFWGNTHYAALFGPAPGLPFHAACVGHGGFPYTRVKSMKPGSPAPCLWIETESRFPGFDVCRDRGLNGYVELGLNPDGSMSLDFVSWMGVIRKSVTLRKSANGVVIA